MTFDSYPTVSQIQDTPFTVEIVDSCDEPFSIASSGTLTDQEYTITQVFYEYVVPAYTIEPAWCPITYSY